MTAYLWSQTYISHRCTGCRYSREGKESLGIEDFSNSDPCMSCKRVNLAMKGPEFTDKFTPVSTVEIRKIWSI